MGAFDEAPLVQPDDRESWRAWLEANHRTARGVWLVTWRANSGGPILAYEAAVEEALCFGWVDGRGGKVDERRTKLYFSPRRPRSAWARPNKERIARLLAAGRMAPAGIAAVERAKENGSWTALDAVERLEVPDDLAAAFADHPPARAHWDAFPPSARRAILAWISSAKRLETREKRVSDAAILAQRNERAGQRPADA